MCTDERCRHPYTCDCPEQCNKPEDRLEPVFRDILNGFLNEIATESVNALPMIPGRNVLSTPEEPSEDFDDTDGVETHDGCPQTNYGGE